MSEVVRQLDFAATENLRLRERLQYNNEVLDRKLQEIEVLLRQKETDARRMEKTVEQKEKEKEGKFLLYLQEAVKYGSLMQLLWCWLYMLVLVCWP